MDLFTLVTGGVILVLLVALARRRSSSGAPSAGGIATVPWKPLPYKKVTTAKTGKHYAVVGGSGYLGSHIVEALLARGEEHVRIVDLREPSLFHDHPNVEFYKTNILNKEELKAAVKGIDTVFYTAAYVDYWSRFEFQKPLIYAINVTGLENALEVCADAYVKQFIYTSSSTVLLGKGQSIKNGDESLPYPEHPVNLYGLTKGIAERAVLKANGKKGMLTASVRPNGIFGPRDALMLGELHYSGNKPEPLLAEHNLQDWSYVENVVHAQLQLETHLTDEEKAPAGNAYCLSADRPMAYREFWTQANRALGGSDEDIWVLNRYAVVALAYISEALTWLTRGRLKGRFFTLTPSVLDIATRDLYFNSAKAVKDFGYVHLYTMEEALQQCQRYYRPDLAKSEASDPHQRS